MALHRWEDVKAVLFAGREAEIAAGADELRLEVAAQDLADERDLAAWGREMARLLTFAGGQRARRAQRHLDEPQQRRPQRDHGHRAGRPADPRRARVGDGAQAMTRPVRIHAREDTAMTAGRHRPAPGPAPVQLVVYRSPWWLPRLLFLAAAVAFLFAGLDFTGHEVWIRSAYAWIAYGLALFAAGWAVP